MIRTADAAARQRAPLWHALALDEAERTPVVAIVGAGGKTSLVYALAREVAALGGRAIVTGTARFTPAPHSWRMPPLVEARPGAVALAVAGAAGEAGVLVVTGVEPQPAGRLAPVAPEDIAALAAVEGVDAVLVEADGSRTRAFKAPGDHEPVIPDAATHVIAVVGASVLGQPVDEVHVHRPQRVRVIVSGLPPDARCDAALIARVLAHEAGGRKHVGQRPFAAVVNQADTHPEAARTIAEAVRGAGISLVLVTTLRDPERPVRG